eukprot:2872003-Pleurochrysis_carterae.AAC.1
MCAQHPLFARFASRSALPKHHRCKLRISKYSDGSESAQRNSGRGSAPLGQSNRLPGQRPQHGTGMMLESYMPGAHGLRCLSPTSSLVPTVAVNLKERGARLCLGSGEVMCICATDHATETLSHCRALYAKG